MPTPTGDPAASATAETARPAVTLDPLPRTLAASRLRPVSLDERPLRKRGSAVPARPAPSARDVEPKAVEFLRLLADPTRRRIFLLLMEGEICNCEVAAELGLAENLVSHHLRRLREAGLADEHRDTHDARWVHFTVNRHALDAAWRALGAAFDPSRLGSRVAGCRRTSGPDPSGQGGTPGTGRAPTRARRRA